MPETPPAVAKTAEVTMLAPEAREPARKRRPRRDRTTRTSVIVFDKLARLLISVAGWGTIASIMAVCVFLVYVVVPLFLPARLAIRPAVTLQASIAAPADQAAFVAGESDLINVSDERAPTDDPTAAGDGDDRVAVELPAAITSSRTAATLRHLAVDDYLSMAWTYQSDGRLRNYRVDTGELLEDRALFDERPTAAFFARDGACAFGFSTGRVAMGRIRYATTFLEATDLPEALRQLPAGAIAAHDGGAIQRTPEGQFRLQQLEIALDEPIDLKTSEAVVQIARVVGNAGEIFAALTDAGELRVARVTKTRNLITRKETVRLTEGRVKLEIASGRGLPEFLLLTGLGDNVFVAWPDGRLQRHDIRNLNEPQMVEEVDLLPESAVRLTAARLHIGGSTLLAGDSLGRVRAWFRIKPTLSEATIAEEAARAGSRSLGSSPPPPASRPIGKDGSRLVQAHELIAAAPEASGESAAAVTAIVPSSRSRIIAAGYDDGRVELFYVTNNRHLGGAVVEGRTPIQGLTLGGKDDAVLAFSEAPSAGDRTQANAADASVGEPRAGPAQLTMIDVDAPHAEITPAALIRPVWYEGYERPEHVWQSTGGADDFEPKLGLYPLIFGTLKATFYSMLFGVPLAILAAIYSSEFLSSRVKARIKPSIEMMAGLPSVVLGFLAALILAPLIEDIVPSVLALFILGPFCLLLGAHLWQLLPNHVLVRMGGARIFGAAAALGFGLAASWRAGPLLERWLFDGNIKHWLSGQGGSPLGGWFLLLLPSSAVLAAFIMVRWVNPPIYRLVRGRSPRLAAVLSLGLFLSGTGLALLLSLTMSWGLAAIGWDVRGSIFDTYVQRNALVVGFIMGFAIIPIIYTIAEDAFSAVPEHLRAGSLGAGATPWQTAVRIILPTAMSGVFSAVMIGLGRAVGETMIVLMAAGNTPVMDLNIFNGFRTLSANIAVEMPEAVQHSTHFRTLFLAALTLFAMTFAVNTAAEIIRQRFRKRAYQL